MRKMSYQVTQIAATAGRTIMAAGVALTLGAVTTAEAGDARNGIVKADTAVSLAFDFVSSGFRLLTLDFELGLSGDRYRASSVIKTKGIGSFISKMKTQSAVSGIIKSVGLLPEKFGMTIKTSDKKRKYLLNWAKDGTISVKRTKQPREYKVKEMDAATTAGMPDPMTVIISAALFQHDRPCTGSYKVINGKEVYALKFTLRGKDKIGKKAKGAYRGEAYLCDVLYTPIAGLSRRKMAKFRSDPMPPMQIWMAPVQTETLSRPLLLPVKVNAEIDWVSTAAYLRKGTVNGKPLNSKSYAKR